MLRLLGVMIKQKRNYKKYVTASTAGTNSWGKDGNR